MLMQNIGRGSKKSPVFSWMEGLQRGILNTLRQQAWLHKVSVLKRPKSQDESELPPAKKPLSPLQRQRAEENRVNAKIKLLSRKLAALSPNVGSTWFKALEPEFTKPYFQKLSSFIEQERQKHIVYPPENQVYTWTQMCAIRQVKVVILGQDPYHGPNQAHGLAFSVPKGITSPPSLVNMFKELADDISGFCLPPHGDLTGWAEQGVLLLNASLTVRAHQPNSHKDQGWEQLTDAVVAWLNENLDGIVFLLWGSYAQKKGAVINKKKHLVLQCAHPSPLSVHRGFFGCRHFSKANNYLKKVGKSSIDWCKLPLRDNRVADQLQ